MKIAQYVIGYYLEAEFTLEGARFLTIKDDAMGRLSIEQVPPTDALQLIDWLGNTLNDYRSYCSYLESGTLV